ncbi:signal transduction histidine kinase [Nitrospirillum amazonense]|uniref:histidine kinase n=1 Tax=Nitrospirillum amazonense TaxID=28077 RepID=A0A560FGP9_9PROT|nr:HAMP domain-containing sensor histidine kinase [Nitrospirillum amazonense]TWB20769.1 signal transduction histidine kinase [Nitrospirillum amazonense]
MLTSLKRPASKAAGGDLPSDRHRHLGRLLRTTTFRFALIYLGLFIGSVLLVLWLIYWSTAGFLAGQADTGIREDMQALADRYRTGGMASLAEAVNERGMGNASSIYILSAGSGATLAGNQFWPKGVDEAGWANLPVKDPSTGQVRPGDVRALIAVLPGGYRVLVGRDLGEVRVLRERLERVIGWSMGLALVLGLMGGLAMSRVWLRRLDGVTRTAEAIREGMLVSRVPLTGSGDEFDQLAHTLNAMLDRIEALVAGIRHVSQGIAHDLRTPLTRLRTRLELALMHDTVENPREVLEAAIEEVDHLLATFRALLAIAEVESGGNLPIAPVPLDTLALSTGELYDAVAEDQGITFTMAVEATGPAATVQGNRQLLGQALANLLDNALKYTPEGGHVSLTVTADGPFRVKVTVADNGPGIPAEDRERVRERFFRLDRDQARPGSGLGLSLVDAVAQRHGGTLVLSDNGPGLKAQLLLPVG